VEKAGAEMARSVGTERQALQIIEHIDFDGALLDALHGRSVDDIVAALARRNIPFVFVTGNARAACRALSHMQPSWLSPLVTSK
jgi:hypothetical protein